MDDDDAYFPVPDHPPLPPGLFAPLDWWWECVGGPHRVKAALGAGALVEEPLGPRGGAWQAVYSERRWCSWAQDFNRRAYRRWEGQRALNVQRRLVGRRK